MSHNDRIDAALADLNSQDVVNYSATARIYGVDRNTLARRHKNIQSSREEVAADTRSALNLKQEEVLIRYILKLTDRGTPPSPHIVKNMAEELAKRTLGKHWIERFLKRHKNQLNSIYLRSIDHLRQKADFVPYIAEFYRLVSPN